jgi:hypothetical protein
VVVELEHHIHEKYIATVTVLDFHNSIKPQNNMNIFLRTSKLWSNQKNISPISRSIQHDLNSTRSVYPRQIPAQQQFAKQFHIEIMLPHIVQHQKACFLLLLHHLLGF